MIEFAIDWFGSNFFKVYFTFFSLVELIDLLVAVAVVVALAVVVSLAVVVAVIVAVRHLQLSSRNFLELLFRKVRKVKIYLFFSEKTCDLSPRKLINNLC